MASIINKTYQPYQMTKLASFGNYKNTETRTGIIRQSFKEIAKLHFAFVNQTISQKHDAIGSKYQDSRIIAIQHNSAINDKLTCKIDDKVYKILDVSPGHDTYISYDLVTLSLNKDRKGGS